MGRSQEAKAVRTHGDSGYRRGCRCATCRKGAVERVREYRARTRKPCEMCRRIHGGPRCPVGYGWSMSVYLPSRLHVQLADAVPAGKRSSFVRRLIEEALR